MPKRIVLIGIEGRCFDLPREHMSQAVADAVDPAVNRVLALLQSDNSLTNPTRSLVQ
jgi:hydrogenase maturation protease